MVLKIPIVRSYRSTLATPIRPGTADLDRVGAVFDRLMHALMATHAPELNAIDLTSPATRSPANDESAGWSGSRGRRRPPGSAARPILMTAIATILALIPLAAGFNQGSIIAAELGTVVIGGLFSSTFLTLLVVPAVYLLIDGVKRRVGRRFAGAPEAATAPAGAAPAS